jgi:hypothetical protein
MMTTSARNFLTRQNLFRIGLLVLALVLLAIEVVNMLPQALALWHPYDYWQYTQMGRAVLQGRDPLGPGRYYPLPTILWVFVPLSLAPDWFRIIWVIAPFVFMLVLFRREGLWLLFFVPFWMNIADGMLDGWLLIPMAWLLADRPVLAGLGAVMLLAKPQLAALTVVYMVLRWLVERDWKNLIAFAGGLIVFVTPAFILDSTWPLRLLQVLPLRASETISILPRLTSSVWSWWSLGDGGKLVSLALLIVAGVIFWRAFRRKENRAASFQSLNLLLIPVLFASNSIVLAPALRNRKQIVVVVLISLAAYLLDNIAGGFGGGYVLIPLAVLYFQKLSGQPAINREFTP